ncbi:hypothetical protein BU15DRAFT_63685 [Melanogaster broomeanus]|nr:hypothetical protein BU15DRAFT_63685 [Melanogaster broomeanus]
MSYIKPLNNSVGPRQRNANSDEAVHCDFEDHTPDVPSGGVFLVKTRTCLMWASSISTRVIVTKQVNGRGGISSKVSSEVWIEGQKVYHSDLDKAIRMVHPGAPVEFIPEGIDPTAVCACGTYYACCGGQRGRSQTRRIRRRSNVKRERDRNRRGLQWAYDTFEGLTTSRSGRRLARWSSSEKLGTNLRRRRLGGGKRRSGRRREEWVQGVVSGCGGVGCERSGRLCRILYRRPVNLQTELANIGEALDAMEDRMTMGGDNPSLLRRSGTEAGPEDQSSACYNHIETAAFLAKAWLFTKFPFRSCAFDSWFCSGIDNQGRLESVEDGAQFLLKAGQEFAAPSPSSPNAVLQGIARY